MPQIAPPLVIQATTTFSGAVLSEASLSFLGVGTRPGDGLRDALDPRLRRVATREPVL